MCPIIFIFIVNLYTCTCINQYMQICWNELLSDKLPVVN